MSTPEDSKRAGHEAETGEAQDATPAIDATLSEAATESTKKRSQSFSALLPFGSKAKAEPKERQVDEIRVADGALASIIGLAAHEVPGVVGMAPANITEGIRRILGARQVDEGVEVEHPNGEDRADVDLHVVVAYGVNIPVVAESIRERVRYAAESLAGITLDEVRVHVAGISRG